MVKAVIFYSSVSMESIVPWDLSLKYEFIALIWNYYGFDFQIQYVSSYEF